ncbi:hypothetical protein GZL_00759 [Streptomyces sp. 769]|nr:hypothetical protein GZL_00759 [Streptomyces sp. 769]
MPIAIAPDAPHAEPVPLFPVTYLTTRHFDAERMRITKSFW